MINDRIIRISESENDREFLKRVYADGIEKYKTRHKAIDFQGKENVLDAGCGFGQWTFALAELNSNIEAFDFSQKRIEVCRLIQKEYYPNSKINFEIGNLEKTKFENNSFSLIFCYSSIYFTDFEKSLKELYRILKPNGKLYINTNDIGWYIYNLKNDHNSNSEFSSQQMALNTFRDSMIYYSQNIKVPGSQTIMPVEVTINLMKEIGFKHIIWDGDGMINLTNKKNVKQFFHKYYYNEVGVYEVLCQK